MGVGGKAARPIYEYFFAKVYADKTLGIDRNARFMRPESLANTNVDSFNIDPTRPPGTDIKDLPDRKTANYFDTSGTSDVPLDTKPFVDEVKSTKNPVTTPVANKPDSLQVQNRGMKPDGEVKKKRGLFGGKKND